MESILKSERQGKIIRKAKDSIIFDLFIHLFKYLLTTYYFQSDGGTQILKIKTQYHFHTS